MVADGGLITGPLRIDGTNVKQGRQFGSAPASPRGGWQNGFLWVVSEAALQCLAPGSHQPLQQEHAGSCELGASGEG